MSKNISENQFDAIEKARGQSEKIDNFFQDTNLENYFQTVEFRALMGDFLSKSEKVITNKILKKILDEKDNFSFVYNDINNMKRRDLDVFNNLRFGMKVADTTKGVFRNLVTRQKQRDLLWDKNENVEEEFLDKLSDRRYTPSQIQYQYIVFQLSEYFGIKIEDVSLPSVVFIIEYLPGFAQWLSRNGYGSVVTERFNGKLEIVTSLYAFKFSEQ